MINLLNATPPSSGGTASPKPADAAWVSGTRYPNGQILWTTMHSGQAAWTPDAALASRHPSRHIALLAARVLEGDHAEPFCAPAPLSPPPAGQWPG